MLLRKFPFFGARMPYGISKRMQRTFALQSERQAIYTSRGSLARCLNYGTRFNWQIRLRECTFATLAESEPQDTQSSDGRSRPVGFPYRLYAAVILERYPVITPDLTEFEEKYAEWAEQIHIEKSKYSLIELKDQEEEPDETLIAKPKGKKKGKGNEPEPEPEEEPEVPVGEFESLADDDQKEAFVPANRVTSADIANDRRSLTRALQRTLYLLVRELPRKGTKDKPQWRFPQAERTGGENLRETAERAATTGFDNDGKMGRFFIGNCPTVHLVSEHQRDTEGFIGSQVYMFRAQWLQGRLHLHKKYSDYVWVTREEIKEYVAPDYYDRVILALRR